jgi:putative ABC transport system permease protein
VVTYRLAKNVNTHTAIDKIGKIFGKYNPAYPYQYKFVNDEYEHKFNLEVLVGKLAGVFAGLAIFISCLGLFGLAAYVAEQRTKEIGIRKVLGCFYSAGLAAAIARFYCAGGHQLRYCLAGGVLLSAQLASTVHLPRQHRCRGVHRFGAPRLLVITLVTISFQAIKAALANPVHSLRSE